MSKKATAKWAVILGLWIALFATSALAQPTEVYVDASFDGSEPGYGVTQFETIKAGIDAVAVGGTVHVAPGSYNEIRVALNKSCVILGPNADVSPNTDEGALRVPEAIVRNGVNNTASNVTINGMELHGSYTVEAYRSSGPDYINLLYNIVRDVDVFDPLLARKNIILMYSTTGSNILHNRILNAGRSIGTSAGLHDTVISHNVMIQAEDTDDCQAVALSASNPLIGSGISNVTITHNTIIGAGSDGEYDRTGIRLRFAEPGDMWRLVVNKLTADTWGTLKLGNDTVGWTDPIDLTETDYGVMADDIHAKLNALPGYAGKLRVNYRRDPLLSAHYTSTDNEGTHAALLANRRTIDIHFIGGFDSQLEYDSYEARLVSGVPSSPSTQTYTQRAKDEIRVKNLRIEHNTLSDAYGAFGIRDNDTVVVSGNQYVLQLSSRHTQKMRYTEDVYVRYNRFINNKTHTIMGLASGVYHGGWDALDVRENYWDHTSGPYHAAQNPAGQGDMATISRHTGKGVSGSILFDPWLLVADAAQVAAVPAGNPSASLGYSGAVGMTIDFDTVTTAGELVATYLGTNMNVPGTDGIPAGTTVSPMVVRIATDAEFDSATVTFAFADILDKTGWKINWVKVFTRSPAGSGDYAPLDTSYNATAGTLTVNVTGFSDFIFVQSKNFGRYHPADVNQDWQLTAGEVTSYAAAWRRGESWPTGPVPIPIGYVVRAGALWRAGEQYQDNGGDLPLAWVIAE